MCIFYMILFLTYKELAHVLQEATVTYMGTTKSRPLKYHYPTYHFVYPIFKIYVNNRLPPNM